MQASAIQVCNRGRREPAAGPVEPKHKVFRDKEVKLQSCSVETVERVVKQRAKSVRCWVPMNKS